MPEMPEVAALAGVLDEKLSGKVIAAGHLVSFSALKTFKIGLDALAGLEIDGVTHIVASKELRVCSKDSESLNTYKVLLTSVVVLVHLFTFVSRSLLTNCTYG